MKKETIFLFFWQCRAKFLNTEIRNICFSHSTILCLSFFIFHYTRAVINYSYVFNFRRARDLKKKSCYTKTKKLKLKYYIKFFWAFFNFWFQNFFRSVSVKALRLFLYRRIHQKVLFFKDNSKYMEKEKPNRHKLSSL